jgi:hypothetical protein
MVPIKHFKELDLTSGNSVYLRYGRYSGSYILFRLIRKINVSENMPMVVSIEEFVENQHPKKDIIVIYGDSNGIKDTIFKLTDEEVETHILLENI